MFKKNLISILLFLGFLFNAYCISNVLYNDEIHKYSCVHKTYLRQFMLFLPDGFEKRSIQERMDVPLIIMLRHHSWPVKDFSGLDCNKIIIEYFNSFMNKERKSDFYNNLIIPEEPDLLEIFKKSYTDIVFNSKYDEKYEDWLITVNIGTKKYDFYWNNGSMLPEEEMKNRNEYWTLLYNYDYKKPLLDPADFTDEQIAAMKKFGSDENRKSSAGTPMFFFDAIYDGSSRASLEKHIISVRFLGFNVNVHERLKEPLTRIEKRIYNAAEKSSDVKNFLNTLNSNGGYYWRIIANTNRKSFHSLGIALDLQPKSYGWKEVYWSWAKDKNPDGWMLTPLKDRWMPPQEVMIISQKMNHQYSSEHHQYQ